MRAWLALALLAGCTVSGTGVSLTIEGPGLAPDTLEISARYSGKAVSRTVPLGGATLPTTLLAELPDESLKVTFDVVARQAGQLLAQASSSPIDVEPHQIARATVVLGGGGGDAGVDLTSTSGDGGGGQIWTLQHGGVAPLAANAMTSIWGVSATDIYVTARLASNVNLFHSGDRGKMWTGTYASLVTNLNLNAVWAAGQTDVYLAGDGGVIVHGSGITFTTETNPALSTTSFNALWGTGTNDIYAVGSGNTILHRVAGGWVVKGPTTAASTIYYDVWGANTNDVYAVGSGGVIVRSMNGGAWTALTSTVATDLHGVWGSGAGDVYVVGDSGVVLHSTGDGMWTKQTTGVPNVQLMHVWGTGPSEQYACGASWTLLRSTGNGVWTADLSGLTVNNPTTDRFNRIWGAGSSDIYAVGAGQTIVHRP